MAVFEVQGRAERRSPKELTRIQVSESREEG